MRRKPIRRRTAWFYEDVLAWLLFIIAVASILYASDYLLNRRILPAQRDLPNSVEEPKIVVLAFDRIVTEPAPNKISRKQLRGHLSVLEREGFVAVSLENLAQFYESEAPLPDKSLLLTFDHGYFSTYEAVDPLLREFGWPAVMFIMTERQTRRDPFFIYWDRVERMVASGLWDIGTHGHRGHDPIVVDATGDEGPFFIRAMWLPRAGRAETWDEFGARVGRDHERAYDILTSNVRGDILAYAPPLRDVAGLTAAPEAHQTLEEIVESRYRLAFFDDRFGVNDRRSNPKRLRRLRVDPTWGSEELLRRVDFAMGDEPDVGGAAAWSDPWVSGSGRASLVNEEELVVTGDRRADVWFAGSQWVDDWEIEGEIRIEGGQLWIVQESERGPEQWRFGGTQRRTYLQTRSPGHRTQVVESYPARITAGRWHHLRLIKRGIGIWIELDHEVITETPTYLPGRWRGNVGVVHWSQEQTNLRIRNLRFRKIPFEAHVLSSSLATEEIQAAIAQAPRLSALSPRMFELGPGGLRTVPVDVRLLQILSHRFGWEIVPTLEVTRGWSATDVTALEPILPSSSPPAFSGLRVEWRGVPPETQARIVDALESRARDLSWKNGRLIVTKAEMEANR